MISVKNLIFEDRLFDINVYLTDEFKDNTIYEHSVKFEINDFSNLACVCHGHVDFISCTLYTECEVFCSVDDIEALRFFKTKIVEMCLKMILFVYPNLVYEQKHVLQWFREFMNQSIDEYIDK